MAVNCYTLHMDTCTSIGTSFHLPCNLAEGHDLRHEHHIGTIAFYSWS